MPVQTNASLGEHYLHAGRKAKEIRDQTDLSSNSELARYRVEDEDHFHCIDVRGRSRQFLDTLRHGPVVVESAIHLVDLGHRLRQMGVQITTVRDALPSETTSRANAVYFLKSRVCLEGER